MKAYGDKIKTCIFNGQTGHIMQDCRGHQLLVHSEEGNWNNNNNNIYSEKIPDMMWYS